MRKPAYPQSIMMGHESYHLFEPIHQSCPVVFSSPHSGRKYPKAFVESSQLDSLQLRTSEDAYINEIFARVTEMGAPLLAAIAPRAFLDLNRSIDELDPALIEGVEASKVGARALSGLGIIPRVVSDAKEIRSGKMSRLEADARIARYYHPYHTKLGELLSQTRQRFGWALLVDCHSMPTIATNKMVVKGGGKPDVVIGTRFGASCDQSILDQVEQACRDVGLKTSINVPFAGAYTMQKYGRPAGGLHAIQIEIDRSLYMDEQTIQKHSGYWELRDKITALSDKICQCEPPIQQMAAE